MATYKTPGVYIEEIALFPPSVAQVETAIPAFIGYTEKAIDSGGSSLTNKPTRITSLLNMKLILVKQKMRITLKLLIQRSKILPALPLRKCFLLPLTELLQIT